MSSVLHSLESVSTPRQYLAIIQRKKHCIDIYPHLFLILSICSWISLSNFSILYVIKRFIMNYYSIFFLRQAGTFHLTSKYKSTRFPPKSRHTRFNNLVKILNILLGRNILGVAATAPGNGHPARALQLHFGLNVNSQRGAATHNMQRQLLVS